MLPRERVSKPVVFPLPGCPPDMVSCNKQAWVGNVPRWMGEEEALQCMELCNLNPVQVRLKHRASGTQFIDQQQHHQQCSHIISSRQVWSHLCAHLKCHV